MRRGHARGLAAAAVLTVVPLFAWSQAFGSPSLTGGLSGANESASAPGSTGLNITPSLPSNLFDTGSTLGPEAAQSPSTRENPLAAAAPGALDAVLAMSTPDYPVSPGDVYVLSYLQSVRPVSERLVVQSDFTVNLGIFKTIDARGMTFSELRRRVLDIVTTAYPDSSPQLVIAALGLFPVAMKGEVELTGYYPVNGLTRLAAFLEGRLTPSSSIRNVEVRSPKGTERSYDLFLATRDGELSQDPYVRPGDTVIVRRAQRTVELTGAVRRPGTYQLRAGDTLSTLLSEYGEGFTPRADRRYIRVERQGADPSGPPTSFFVNASASIPSVPLEDLDRVFVPTKTLLRPVVFVEGAIVVPKSEGASSASLRPTATLASQSAPTEAELHARYLSAAKGEDAPSAANVIILPFSPGDTLAYLLQQYRSDFLPTSDLSHAELIRDGKMRTVNLLTLLYYPNQAGSSDVVLQPNDRILIPFVQQFVTVAGAVEKPGNYPYVPGRTYSYYTALAGGVDRSKNVGSLPVVTDRNGIQLEPSAPLQPEDQVTWSMNSPTITLGPLIAILGGIASITTIVFDFFQIFNVHL